MIPFLAGLLVSGIALAIYCCVVDGIHEYRWFEARPVRERKHPTLKDYAALRELPGYARMSKIAAEARDAMTPEDFAAVESERLRRRRA